MSDVKPTVFSGTYFDTFITITIYDNCSESINEALMNICEEYDLMFSTGNPDSLIYQINNSQGEPVECNEEFINLLKEAVSMASSTNGKLDPTIETVSSLYNFTGNEEIIPTKEDITNALKAVDYNNIIISANYVSLNNSAKINLGYIAKGYIADKISQFLLDNNINNALINLGGNIITLGAKYNTPFTIGIKKPFTDNEVLYSFNSTNESIVTSGIYERYCYNNNKLYHHILDTKTGYPIENHAYSVTIIGKSSTLCDLYSTLLLILGPDEGIKYIENIQDYEAMYILDDYSTIKSSGFYNNSL